MKSGVNPTGPDHSKNRETVFSDHCHQTGPVSGGQRDRNFCQTACRVQTNPISGLTKPWWGVGGVGVGGWGVWGWGWGVGVGEGGVGGWTLGSTNVEGGLHSPFPA